MKIECDKCGAKYSIADDKVRGKTFKIRCKKCSNVIIVRDKAAGGDASESEAPADEPGWHLAIGGETVGPLTEAEVREKHASGEIDRETSVWQEGFEDWLPLGEVAAFSDLAERSDGAGAGAGVAAAAAADPFSSGGEDDYSRNSFGGGGGASEDFGRSAEPARANPVAASPRASTTPVAASPSAAPAADSPRVGALSSARNENSVLFSLDSLSTMAMGSGKPSGGGGGSSSPSSFSVGGGGGGGGHTPSASGNSEGSGLIDIRSMGAMLGGGGGGGGGSTDDDRDDSMLPSFGGTGFGGLAAAPLLTAAPAGAPEPVIAEPQRNNQTPLYLLIGVLVLGLGGLAAYVLTRPPPEPQERIVERIVAPAVQPDKKDEDEKKDEKKKAKDEDGEDGDAEAGEEAPAVDDKAGTTKGGTKGTTKGGDKKGGDSTPAATGETKTETKETKKPPESDVTPSVECILDPSKCKKGGGGGTTPKPPPDSSMPEKLELADIKAGVSGPKAAAESSCKSKAKGGEKVKIKLSINGPAGTVLSSSVDDDAGNAALGSCVAAELKKSTFKKVQKEQIGTVVSVSF